MNEILDFKSIRIALLNQKDRILPDLLPGGRISGRHWECGDYTGSPGSSFKLDLDTGKWKDFADQNVSGGDFIALYALQNGVSMLEAGLALREKYLGGAEVKYNYPAPAAKPPQTIIKPPIDAEKPDFPRGSTQYIYREPSGDILFYIVRCVDESTGKKFFYPLTFSSDKKWLKKGWPEKKPLYNIATASRSTKPVIIVEGEKAADAAMKVFTAYDVVTWAGGSQAVEQTDWSTLTDRKVIIWPDADDAGLLCAAKLQEKLKLICSQVKLINTDKEDGWDAYDCFVHEKWDFSRWAAWAKPLLTEWNRPAVQEVEVLEAEPEASANRSGQLNAEDIIQTDEFPATPNNQFLFNKLGLQRSGNGSIVMNASNVAKIIRHEMPGLVWRDTFYNANMTKWQDGEEREWTEEDTNNLFIKMQVHYDLAKLAKAHLEDGINFVACMDKRNEPQDYVNSLKWDGQPRVDKFFQRAMQVEDSEYTTAVSKNFWISMVARILSPGCQVDEMVVLESGEGTGKTSALIEIAGKWYGRAGKDLRNKDFDQGLVGKILVDFSELSQMKNSDIEIVKDMITCREDQYRPSFGKRVGKFPRTCILAGTTNESEYLKSSTGNRRFNPIAVGEVDIRYIKENRDQLFAEATARFKSEEPWWLYPKEEAEEARESRREVDEWELILKEYVESPQGNSIRMQTRDLWFHLGGTVEKLDKFVQMRIGKVMRKIGYEKKSMRIGATTGKYWIKKENK